MTHHETPSVIDKTAFSAAGGTAEKNAVDTDSAKGGVGFCAAANEAGAAAGFAKYSFARHGLRRVCLAFQLGKFRFLRLVLALKIGALALKCRVLRLNESDALLEDRRRAMFVDEFFKKIKHRKFSLR